MPTWIRPACLSVIVAGIVALLLFTNVIDSTAERSADNLSFNPSFEDSVDETGLPKGWSFVTTSGTYEFEVSKSTSFRSVSHSGPSSLSFGGAGGIAELRTNAFNAPGNSVVECEAWVKNELVRGGRTSVFVRIPGTESLLPDFPSIEIDPYLTNWQRVHFMYRPSFVGSGEHSPMLAIRLSGEALVRVDDVTMKIDSRLVLNKIINDSGFENPAGRYEEWIHWMSGENGACERCMESPRSGDSCVRLAGSGEWSVLASKPKIAAKSSRVVVQAYIRVATGGGLVKLDYLSNGEKIGTTQSKKIDPSDEWKLVVLEGDEQLMSKATAITVVLTAVGEFGDYVVDFDEVEVFTQK